jgi:hypothetical protein
MKYLIRDGQSYPVSDTSAAYRGTDRTGPIHCDAVAENHEINKLFEWYLEETESGFIRDLAKARRYAALCNQHFPGKQFELIEVTDGKTTPMGGAQLLGFDISFGGVGDSLIFLALLAGPSTLTLPEKPILVLSDLIRRYFFPKLNEFGLFRTFEDAAHCRRAMIALQSFHPNLYEGGDLEVFTVTGVYLVPQSENGAV